MIQALEGMHYFIRPLVFLEQQTVHFLNHSQRVYKASETPYLHFGRSSVTRKALAQIQRTIPGVSLPVKTTTIDLGIIDFSVSCFCAMLPAVFILFFHSNS